MPSLRHCLFEDIADEFPDLFPARDADVRRRGSMSKPGSGEPRRGDPHMAAALAGHAGTVDRPMKHIDPKTRASRPSSKDRMRQRDRERDLEDALDTTFSSDDRNVWNADDQERASPPAVTRRFIPRVSR